MERKSGGSNPRRWQIARVLAFAVVFFFLLLAIGPYQAARLIPVPFWDWGACPGCAVGQRLVANTRMQGVREPGEHDSIEPGYVIRPHEVLTVLDSAIEVQRAGRARMKIAKTIAGARIVAGDEVRLLSTFPECTKVWFVNSVWRLPQTDREMAVDVDRFDVCRDEAEVIEPAQQVWWLQVQGRDQAATWLRNPDVSDTDRVLLSALEATPHDGAAKLAAIDRLLAVGVDLNGPAGKHDRAPAQTVIETGDIAFIRAMRERGMRVADGIYCDYLFPTVFAPDRHPEFFADLLADGLLEQCKARPESLASVLFGSATETYDEERAIHALDTLVAAGFPLDLRDARGMTLLDRVAAKTQRGQRLDRMWHHLNALGGGE